jgi:hypothetical protein
MTNHCLQCVRVIIVQCDLFVVWPIKYRLQHCINTLALCISDQPHLERSLCTIKFVGVLGALAQDYAICVDFTIGEPDQ